MPGLSYAAALALAAQCGAGVPSVPPDMIVGLAFGESGLQPHIVSPRNANGTYDNGIGQINDATLALVGLTKETAQDPCKNMAGMARYLRIISGYHRGPAGQFDAPYVKARLADIAKMSAEPSPPPARAKISLADQFPQPAR